jgi:hypothetical protein
MRDERSRHLRQLRRLRSSVRRWTITAGALVGATAILVPYQGLGAVDAIWAGLAGGSLALSWWRWADHRTLAAQPVPDPVDPALAGDQWLALLAQLPGGHAIAERARRVRTRGALRGSAAASSWERLDRASRSLRELTVRLAALDGDAAAEAAAAERRLRELTSRIAGLEEALRLAPAEAHPPLAELRDEHFSQLDAGVSAYEQFVVAAANYLSESGRLGGGDDALAGLTDATERLRGVTEGLAELRRLDEPAAQAD